MYALALGFIHTRTHTRSHMNSGIHTMEVGFPSSSAGKRICLQCRRPQFDTWSGGSAGEGIGYPLQYSWASLVTQMVKNLPARRKTWV